MIIFYKNIYKVVFVIALLLIVSGCNNFLTRGNPSNFTSNNYYKTAGEAQSAVNAIYSSLYPVYQGGYNGSPWQILEFATGEANNGAAQAIYTNSVMNLNQSSLNGFVDTWWTSSYHGIANANEAISHIPDINIDQNTKNKLMGEARFLRAYFYFNLVRMFGKVPLITKPQKFKPSELRASRDSVQKVYNLIVNDLKVAEKSGLPFNSSSGRVTLGAVKTLLASVYLTMAGYPLQKGLPYYKKARDEAKSVIDSGKYSLFQSYNDLHDPSKNNTGEDIFSVQFKKSIEPNPIQVQILPFEKGISAYSAETGAIYARSAFVDTYQQQDKRRQEDQFFYTKFTSQDNRKDTVNLNNYYLYKFFDVNAQLNTADSGLNFPILRYAEALLIYAEAENEVEGPTHSAYDALNKVRVRAGLQKLSGLNKSQFRIAVWKELWHELCFENKTWFNMVRLRKAYNLNTGKFDNFIGHQFTYGPTLAKKDLLFPIPQSELRVDKNLTQNPGY